MFLIVQICPKCSLIVLSLLSTLRSFFWEEFGTRHPLIHSRVGRYVKVSIEELSNKEHYILPHAKSLASLTGRGWRSARERTDQCVSGVTCTVVHFKSKWKPTTLFNELKFADWFQSVLLCFLFLSVMRVQSSIRPYQTRHTLPPFFLINLNRVNSVSIRDLSSKTEQRQTSYMYS